MADDYLLGASDEELARLGFQHEIWAATTAELWDGAGFRKGQRLLDLGSGPGFATMGLANRVTNTGSVVAVDASEKSIHELNSRATTLRLANIEAHAADVASFEVESAPFDGIFARWLFCFLRDPASLVSRAAKWLKPGGTFAVLDYFHYDSFALAPPVEVMPRLVKAVQASWAENGGSLDVGGHLPTMMAGAGLTVVDIKPIVHCARPGSPVWDWPVSFFEGFVPVLVEKKYLSPEDGAAFLTALEGHAKNPNAFLMTPPVMAIVARKP